MNLKDKLQEDLKTAMKTGEKLRVDVIRLLKAKIGEMEISKRADLSDDDYLSVLKTAVKQRKEAIELYQKGGRQDLAQKESDELKIVESYMPQQLSPDEVRAMIETVIKESGATSIKEMGNVMKLVMNQVKGRADGKLINQLVRERLQG